MSLSASIISQTLYRSQTVLRSLYAVFPRPIEHRLQHPPTDRLRLDDAGRERVAQRQQRLDCGDDALLFGERGEKFAKMYFIRGAVD